MVYCPKGEILEMEIKVQFNTKNCSKNLRRSDNYILVVKRG